MRPWLWRRVSARRRLRPPRHDAERANHQILLGRICIPTAKYPAGLGLFPAPASGITSVPGSLSMCEHTTAPIPWIRGYLFGCDGETPSTRKTPPDRTLTELERSRWIACARASCCRRGASRCVPGAGPTGLRSKSEPSCSREARRPRWRAPAALRARIEAQQRVRRMPRVTAASLWAPLRSTAVAPRRSDLLCSARIPRVERFQGCSRSDAPLRPAQNGEATLTKTSSGWRIELDATGLPRLEGQPLLRSVAAQRCRHARPDRNLQRGT